MNLSGDNITESSGNLNSEPTDPHEDGIKRGKPVRYGKCSRNKDFDILLFKRNL